MTRSHPRESPAPERSGPGKRLPSRLVWYTVLGGLLLVSFLSGWVESEPSVLAVFLLCASLELLDSSIGMGYGTTLTPVLLLLGYDPLQLVPTILISEFLSGFAASFFHSEAGNVRFGGGTRHLRVAVVLSACSVLGVLIGVSLAFSVPAVVLRRVIGGVILASGLYILVTAERTFRFSQARIVVLALVASFNKALSGGGYGPLMTSGQIMSGVRGRAAIAITSLAEGFTCLAGATAFLLAGERIDPGLLVPVVGGALLSVPLSATIVKRFRENTLRRVIAVLTLSLGALTVLKTL